MAGKVFSSSQHSIGPSAADVRGHQIANLLRVSNGLRTPLLTQAYSQETGELVGDGQLQIADNKVDPTTGGLRAADSWLQANVPPILNSAAYNDGGLLLITFDESGFDDFSGCCASGSFGTGVDGGGRIGLLALSSSSAIVTPGHVTDTPYDHASMLRTIEDGFGIGEHLNNAGSILEKPMTDLFTS